MDTIYESGRLVISRPDDASWKERVKLPLKQVIQMTRVMFNYRSEYYFGHNTHIHSLYFHALLK